MFFTTPLTLPVQQTMILERLLHQIGSCRAAADDANMFFVPSKIAQHIWQKRFSTNSINNMRRGRTKFLMFSNKTDRNTRFLYCLRHSNFHVMERFGLSCHVLSAHNMLHGVTFLVVSSRRNVMPCLAMSCLIKLHHGRRSQGAAISPDDVTWWRSAIKQVPLARDAINPIRFWNRATST